MVKFGQFKSWMVIASLTWSFGYIYNTYTGGEVSWLVQRYKDKLQLLEQVKGPRRILLVGGSGTYFGVNAQQIQQNLGIPVLNLGLDGNVGLDVLLETFLDNFRPGDIVTLIPEYPLIKSEDGIGGRAGKFGIAIGRPGLGKLSAQQIAQDYMLMGVPTLRGLTKSTMDILQRGKLKGYFSSDLNANGDTTEPGKHTIKCITYKVHPTSQHAIERISKFREELQAKGVTLVMELPWVYGSTDDETVRNVKDTVATLSKIAPVLYDKKSLNLKTDCNMFSDTQFHLIPEAKKNRSLELAQQLRSVIASKQK